MKISLLLQTGSKQTRDKPEKTESKDFYNSRTESGIGYAFRAVWFCFFDSNFFQWIFFLRFQLFLVFYVSIPPPAGSLLVHHSI